MSHLLSKVISHYKVGKGGALKAIQDSKFKFSCHKGLKCFTKCCRDLNLQLTPYDILRIKNRLKLTSSEFLRRYTGSRMEQDWGVPIIMLKMRDDENKTCPFVTREGCTIYEDRPSACRTYPLGRAASKIREQTEPKEFYFLVCESHCLGFNENKEWTIEDWKKDQGMDQYNEMNNYWLDIIANKNPPRVKTLDDKKLQMYYMACYSLDEFRKFVFESRFLDIFYIQKDVMKRIKKDEVELLKFGFNWLKFSLFGENTLKIRNEVLEAKRHDLEL